MGRHDTREWECVYDSQNQNISLEHDGLFLTLETLLEDSEVIKSYILALSDYLDNAQKQKINKCSLTIILKQGYLLAFSRACICISVFFGKLYFFVH